MGWDMNSSGHHKLRATSELPLLGVHMTGPVNSQSWRMEEGLVMEAGEV